MDKKKPEMSTIESIAYVLMTKFNTSQTMILLYG